jgi:hypothetical protein
MYFKAKKYFKKQLLLQYQTLPKSVFIFVFMKHF